MKTEQLEIFLSVCKMKSFNLAGKSSNMSHQMVSKTIKNLENELNCTLFERTNQGVMLTAEGEKLHSFAENVMLDIRALHMENKKPAKKQKINVISTMGPVYSFLTSAINDITYFHPELIVSVYNRNKEEIINLIENEKSYLGFITLSEEENFDKLFCGKQFIEYQIIGTDKILMVCSKCHDLAMKLGAVSLREIAKYPIAIYQEDEHSSGWLFHAMEKKKIKYNVQLRTNNVLSLEDAFLNTQFVGTSSNLIRKCNNFYQNPDALAFKTISAVPNLKVILVYNKKVQLEKYQLFLDTVKKFL